MLGNPRIRSALVSLLVCAVSLHHMQGQGVATARISGTLTDDSGAVLVGAPGRFIIVDLAIASYDVLASSPNPESGVRSGVVLTVSASAGLDFRLKVASARENVFVNAQVSKVETQTGQSPRSFALELIL